MAKIRAAIFTSPMGHDVVRITNQVTEWMETSGLFEVRQAGWFPGAPRSVDDFMSDREAVESTDLFFLNCPEDAPSGLTGAAWCEKIGGVELLSSYDEIIEKSDAMMFMCADDVFPHEALAKKALMSGKRLYCDKTFAPDVDSARRMFALAAAFGTQLFTTSAQRYCPDLSQ